MAEPQVLEGTWEEILPRAEELARQYSGQRLKLVIEPEERLPSAGTQRRISPEEMIRTLDELAERNRGLPVLPPEAFERESIYEDR